MNRINDLSIIELVAIAAIHALFIVLMIWA